MLSRKKDSGNKESLLGFVGAEVKQIIVIHHRHFKISQPASTTENIAREAGIFSEINYALKT